MHGALALSWIWGRVVRWLCTHASNCQAPGATGRSVFEDQTKSGGGLAGGLGPFRLIVRRRVL